jgi:Divergent InlB B-repeat domain
MVVAAMIVSDLGSIAPSASGVQPLVHPAIAVNYSVNATGFPLSPYFWGTTVSSHSPLFREEGPLINATPTEMVVYPGGSAGDDINPLITNDTPCISPSCNGTMYLPGAAGPNVSKPEVSEPDFVSWCQAVSCNAIMQVPGEIDNASLAAAIVNYTENTLHFHAYAWEIGNEPEIWERWKSPWADWNYSTKKESKPTPVDYAEEVQAYSIAMRAVDPDIRLIGLPGTGRPNGPWPLPEWINATVLLNGPNLTGIAFHDYSAPINATPGLANFYQYINEQYGLAQRVGVARSAVDGTMSLRWPGIAFPEVFVTEVGSALSHGVDAVYSASYPGALDLAAQMVVGMDLNVTNIDLFATALNTTNSWFLPDGQGRADYIVYSELLSHLGTEIFPVTLGTTDANLSTTLFAVSTVDPADANRSDLLLVNLNITAPVSFDPILPGIVAGSPEESWTWSGSLDVNKSGNQTVTPTSPEPVPQYWSAGVASNFTLAPQSIVLIESYPGAAAPVNYRATGLPSGTRWFLTVDGQVHTSPGPNITLYLPSGSHAESATTLELPLDRTPEFDRERFQPYLPATLHLSTITQNVSVNFATQWALNLSIEPAGSGTISPDISWANATTPVSLTATAKPGYFFNHWSGFGNGSTNSSASTITVDPTSWLNEKAILLGGYPVAFTESGLAPGLVWGVTEDNVTALSTTSVLTILAPNGTHAYAVSPVLQYRSVPTNSFFTVSGGGINISIRYIRLTPPPRLYLVTLTESGLPGRTNWSVSVRNSTLAGAGPLGVNESDGTYGFEVGRVPGYRSIPTDGSFTVNGSALNVPVAYIPLAPPPPPEPVTFNETGLPNGTVWTVSIRGANYSSGSVIQLSEPNGTYGFQVLQIPGYQSVPVNSSFNVSGAQVNVSVLFVKLTPPGEQFGLVFSEYGLVNGTDWSVTVRGLTRVSNSTIRFNETNGTFGVQVGRVSGYRSQPMNFSVNLTGAATFVPVRFIELAPPPPEYLVTWTIAGLPNGTEWSVTVRNQTVESIGSNLTFAESDGTYGYQLSQAVGYRESAPNNGFEVAGLPVFIALNFLPTKSTYSIAWNETGLWFPTTWSVFIDQNQSAGRSSWITVPLRNGTYTVLVVGPPGFVGTPRRETLEVDGAAQQVAVRFVRATFGVVISESGLPEGLNWSIRFSDETFVMEVDSTTLLAPNGSYTFDVPDPAGFFASPSHGHVPVLADEVSLTVRFEQLFPSVHKLTAVQLGLRAGEVAGAALLSMYGTYFIVSRIRKRPLTEG